MSRSRRPIRRGKCICGRTYKVLRGVFHHGKAVADCTILHYVDEKNVQREKWRKRRDDLRSDKRNE